MGRVLSFLSETWKRRNTKISPLAVLHDVQYDKTTAIKALVKSERSTIGKCTYIGTLSAVYDSEVGKFCSIARECYVGGGQTPC